MFNFVVDDMAAHLGDFKPTHVTDGFTSSVYRVVDCGFDAIGRGTDQLDLFVDVITHKNMKCFRLRSSEHIPESSFQWINSSRGFSGHDQRIQKAEFRQ